MNLFLKVDLKKGNKNIINKENIPAIIENNKLEFNLENNLHTIDFARKTFLRENEEYQFIINFFEKSCILTLKKENYTLDIPVDNATFQKEKNTCQIAYLIDTDDEIIKLKIKWEEQNA